MIGINVAYKTTHKHRNIVIYQPTNDDADDFSDDEIEPMIRDVEPVRQQFRGKYGVKSKYNLKHKKVFYGSVLHILGGKAPVNYRRLTKDEAIFDELSAFDTDIGGTNSDDSQGEGSATSLGDTRTTTSPFRKSIRGSTPTVQGMCQIEMSISMADIILEPYMPCKCGEWIKFEFAQMIMVDKDPKTVRHYCKHCNHSITYNEYKDTAHLMTWRTEDGKWTKDGISLFDGDDLIDWPNHVGLKCWAAISFDLTWSDMMATFIKANNANKRGDKSELKTVTNTIFGEQWERTEDKIEHNDIYRRREHYKAQVPAGVKYLTSFTDVQADRFETEVIGWGEGEESWGIEYIRLYGDMTRPEIWNVLADKLRKQYKHESGALIDIKLNGIDCGYIPDQVYAFCKKNGIRNFIPTAGMDGWNRPLADFPREPNKAGVYRTIIGSDTGKEMVFNRLKIQEPGNGYMHFPFNQDYDETYFIQLTAEVKRKKKVKGREVEFFDAGGRRNEPLDIRYGNLAIIRIAQEKLGVDLKKMSLTEKVSAKILMGG